MSILKEIEKIGLVPVIKIDDINDAVPLAKALCDGGLPVAEITFRTDLAKDAMKVIKENCPQMLIGAGTVLTISQVDDAIEAGAKFIVSPGLNPNIVKYCRQKNIAIIPGCSNASDIELALELGLTTVKFFPAEQLGGLAMIKALSAPYTKVSFMPTGGVNAENVAKYISNPKIVACGGTWMIDAKAIKEKNYQKITELTEKAIKSMLDLKLSHIGINTTAAELKNTAEKFANLLGENIQETSKGYFAGESIELLNNGQGKGHIAISTNSVLRAKTYLEFKGFNFDESSALYDRNNRLKLIYLKDEIAGYKIQIINN